MWGFGTLPSLLSSGDSHKPLKRVTEEGQAWNYVRKVLGS